MYKTILVHVDDTESTLQRTAVAARLAMLHGSHLVGAAMTGIPEFMFAGGGVGFGFEPVQLPLAQLHAEAASALARFEDAARAAGVTSLESRCIDDDAGIGMSLQARYSDLLIISQSPRDVFLPRQRSDFPDYVVLNSPRPVLVLPAAASGQAPGRRVTLAWNGSAEAARAFASAIPVLQQAQQVDLVVFDADLDADMHGAEPGADIALYLARHGIRVDVSSRNAVPDPGQSLLAFALEKKSDLIVMGAYGHSRFREILLGGTTRDLLSTSTIALWMCH